MREAPPTGGTPWNGLGSGAGPGTVVKIPVHPRGCGLRGRGLARGCCSVLRPCGAAGGPCIPAFFPLLLQESDSVLRYRSTASPSDLDRHEWARRDHGARELRSQHPRQWNLEAGDWSGLLMKVRVAGS